MTSGCRSGRAPGAPALGLPAESAERPRERRQRVMPGVQQNPLASAPSLGEMLFSPWPLCQQGWSWQMHFSSLSPFSVDVRQITEKRFYFFHYFWHLASVVLGSHPMPLSLPPHKTKKIKNMYMCVRKQFGASLPSRETHSVII